MAKRGLIGRIPIWVRVPGIIALVLVGIVISSTLLDTSGGGHGRSGDDMETGRGGHGTTDGGVNGPGDRNRRHGTGGADMGTDGGGHGSGQREERSGHNQGEGGPAAPVGRDLAAVSAQVVAFVLEDTVFVPVAEVHRGGRA